MRQETIALINAERTRRDKLHGKQSYDPLGWLPILIEEAGEVSREVCDGRYKFCGIYNLAQLRQELVHVAAVAVAWIEDIDRKAQEEKGGTRMTVQDCMNEYARRNGFDGLVGDGCGCSIDSPMPCSGDGLECEFGYVCPCQECDDDLKGNCYAYNDGDFEYMVLPEKCEMRIKIEKEREQQAHGRATEAGGDMEE